ncbi:glucosyltransferase [Acanthamoeba castellanii str. Neff]|uniref:Alpha-1,3-glucosyltransferase n=1 Tax=Acanthamoeba castellanii (strain ATCC 30010 / Neff) TaxID=1257118 RepID=L8HER6_ACACF|nr:glucosyltransferase [Acanthamoeba castellanii str. Neff]ELR22906.1 glucosyltransferase [Acanthamoeba castellanii str. Neff]
MNRKDKKKGAGSSHLASSGSAQPTRKASASSFSPSLTSAATSISTSASAVPTLATKLARAKGGQAATDRSRTGLAQHSSSLLPAASSSATPTSPRASADGDDDVGHLEALYGFMQPRRGVTLLATLCFLVLVRYLVSLHPHSGEGKPPMYGDYEAQRHWMEVTINLPVTDWYRNTTHNDLLYWGLDYPPLTAYHSWLMGHIGKWLEPESMALFTSRGYESVTSKLFMRGTVIAADLAVFLPAVYAFVNTYYASLSWSKRPALLLIDHGHFQYNGTSLGLVLWAVVFILRGRDILGTVFFCLALNYKQMSLYYAPAFFSYLLAKCYRTKSPLAEVSKLAIAVVGTFALCWAPFLLNATDAYHVLERLFPVGRGLYEDKVANFWCTVSPVFKLRQLFATADVLKICGLHLMRGPTPRNFLLSLFITSLSFFLFSYHVHEKSILIPLLPLTCLLLESPHLVSWFNIIAAFSMYPLLAKDGLVVAYVAVLYFAWLPLAIQLPPRPTSLASSLFTASMAGLATIHVVRAIVAAPERYPDAFDLLIAAFGCAHFLAALGLAYRAQCFAEPVLAATAGSTTVSAGHKSRTSDDAKKRK